MEHHLKLVHDFAAKAHGEQKRKYADENYIVHLERVMEICAKYTNERHILAAALLHDVLEDTPVTKTNMEAFLSELMSKEEVDRTIALVDELTDRYTKSAYPRLNRRARKAREAERLAKVSAEAQTIKYADLIDNMTNITEHDLDFGAVFVKESERLLSKMDKGNEQLYKRALEVLRENLDKLKELTKKKTADN